MPHIKPKPTHKGATWTATPDFRYFSKRSRNKTLIAWAILVFAITILTAIVFQVKQAVGQEQTNPPDKQSVIINGSGGIPTSVTVTNEYDVEMSASVEPNICNYCLRNFNPSQCLEACQDIVIKN